MWSFVHETVHETSGDGALYGCLCLHWYKSAGAMSPLMTNHNVQSRLNANGFDSVIIKAF